MFTAMNCFGIPKHFGIPKSRLSVFTTKYTLSTPKHFGIPKYPAVVNFGRPINFGVPNQELFVNVSENCELILHMFILTCSYDRPDKRSRVMVNLRNDTRFENTGKGEENKR